MTTGLAILLASLIAPVAASIAAAWFGPPLARLAQRKLNDDQESRLDAVLLRVYMGLEKAKRISQNEIADIALEASMKFLDEFREEFAKDPPADIIARAKKTFELMHELRGQGGGSLQLPGGTMVSLPARTVKESTDEG